MIETPARLLLSQGRNWEAERIARGTVQAVRKGGQLSLLASALTAYGTALARLSRVGQAEAVFDEAIASAEQAGDFESAGRAALTFIEELGDTLSERRLGLLYLRADNLLSESRDDETLTRLRSCAARLISAPVVANESKSEIDSFLYAAPHTGELLRFARGVAMTERPVLITGETGTGKELVARLVHHWSGRRGGFVAVSCATLSESLLVSQLFGHRKGSFTDASSDQRGVVSEAEGGTLFLDEVGELNTINQAKLLRLIESGEVSPLGSPIATHADVRIIAATNHNLEKDVAAGLFRADLYYRLKGFQIHLPPLRERADDIPVIARHFIELAEKRFDKRVKFSEASISALRELPLRGNARELRSLIERTYLTAKNGDEIGEHTVRTLALRQNQKVGLADAWSGCSLDEEVRIYECRQIQLALEAAQGRVTHAARLLGITHQGLSSILKGRQKDLLDSRQPSRLRRRSMVRKMK